MVHFFTPVLYFIVIYDNDPNGANLRRRRDFYNEKNIKKGLKNIIKDIIVLPEEDILNYLDNPTLCEVFPDLGCIDFNKKQKYKILKNKHINFKQTEYIANKMTEGDCSRLGLLPKTPKFHTQKSTF